MNDTLLLPRRGTRDWLVDTALFLFAVLFGALIAVQRFRALPDPAWLYDVDQVVGAVACVAVWLRRSRPVELAVVLVVLSTVFEFVSGPMLVALFSVAVHRPARTTLAVFGLSVLSATGYALLRPEPDAPPLLLWMFGVAVQAAAVAWGMVVRNRRALVESLRDRAERAETEAHLRADQVRHETRAAIAREMHDVLGHRLSLLSVHAGALEFRPDAPPADVARAATVIRESAHQAMQDLREVIGVLRAPVGELPQATFADVPALVAESERAGMRVSLCTSVVAPVPDTPGRTAYRVVQEALTNARKHAPGAEVRVSLSGTPGAELAVSVGNGPPTGPGPCGPPGQGLAGLAERLALVGGRLEHGPTSDGWRVAAWLPWPP
ncbi:sensor histidine kinase [Actinophytocola sp.]|jgi:signal transduction histidine kinase|uniref:sensor histidine kinase n=1 Tax=Actinophytocola sp. TaxID=1872138 RepID=UPI002EDAA32F